MNQRIKDQLKEFIDKYVDNKDVWVEYNLPDGSDGGIAIQATSINDGEIISISIIDTSDFPHIDSKIMEALINAYLRDTLELDVGKLSTAADGHIFYEISRYN